MTGAIAVGGVAYYLTSKDNEKEQAQPTKQKAKQSIKALLQSKQKAIIAKDSKNNRKWKTKWTAFKGDYQTLKTSSSLWVIKEYDSKHKSKEEAPEEFKEKCISNVELKVTEESEKLFQDVLKYCVDNV